MIVIGCDYHPGLQQIAFVDTETGELRERRLAHREEAEQFYTGWKGQSVRVGMEASGHARWFERLLGELQFELWIGNAAEIRTKRVRKQKTDRQDAQLVVAAPDRRSVSADLGAGFGEPRSSPTAVASASNGADAHARDESTARRGPQRRTTAQESVMAAGRSPGTGVVRTGWLGQPTTPGPARLTRSTDAEDPGTNSCAGSGSGEAFGDTAADDASWSRAADGARLRVGDRNSGTFPLWQASGQLGGTSTVGGVEW